MRHEDLAWRSRIISPPFPITLPTYRADTVPFSSTIASGLDEEIPGGRPGGTAAVVLVDGAWDARGTDGTIAGLSVLGVVGVASVEAGMREFEFSE
eukprot:CAMPEP_0170206988 /NCGR_PEP_ID=MMETSP0116_2-20130129/3064_1 /TAXON_ID=400756 /ORGANISM="Durinskia baltica, Strain CSIRO CS-38" /LENGTH=95 /DNA_ID=CAMNT_0010457431 /DNA_START=90 /DNA_END=377 /DNA_ORIENTATION=-